MQLSILSLYLHKPLLESFHHHCSLKLLIKHISNIRYQIQRMVFYLLYLLTQLLLSNNLLS